MIENEPVKTFNHLAFGNRGVGKKRIEGDGITPTGEFKIAWINYHSRFLLFFGLDYPTLPYATEAYRMGRINTLDYLRIKNAINQGKLPPQNTPLGGAIGIHGIGRGSFNIHRKINWTDGCVAMDNWQIKKLAQWVGIGTRVVIR